MLSAADAGTSTTGLLLVFYIITIVGALAGMMFGAVRMSSMRRQEIRETAVRAQEQAAALAQNTVNVAANTAAIQRLSSKLDHLLEEMHDQDTRITRLER
jgi:uncharacterized protein HemX